MSHLTYAELYELEQIKTSKLELKTEQLEFILKMCINDLYSSSGKFKKTTARVIYKYVNDNNIDI